MRVVVTGASGFIGSNLIKRLLEKKYDVLSISRKNINGDFLSLNTKDIYTSHGLNVIQRFAPNHFIHTAAIAHDNILKKKYKPSEIFKINELMPLKLFRLCQDLNVKKFIFLSTVGVHGTSTKESETINENSVFNYQNIYAKSKFFAEFRLLSAFKNDSTKLIILRPALVYGQNAPGNLRKLLTLIDKQILLPFKGTNNKRSFLYVDNLISAILHSLNHSNIERQPYLIADNELISTPKLIKLIADARNKKANLIKVPNHLLRKACALPFVGSKMQQLTNNFIIDSSLFRNHFQWTQPYDQELAIKNSFNK